MRLLDEATKWNSQEEGPWCLILTIILSKRSHFFSITLHRNVSTPNTHIQTDLEQLCEHSSGSLHLLMWNTHQPAGMGPLLMLQYMARSLQQGHVQSMRENPTLRISLCFLLKNLFPRVKLGPVARSWQPWKTLCSFPSAHPEASESLKYPH